MRFVYYLILVVLTASVFASPIYAEDSDTEMEMATMEMSGEDMEDIEGETKYVEVTRAFPNIYEELDPKSRVIRQPRRGEFLELISQGRRWYKIRTEDGEEGFLEMRAGRVVERKGIFSSWQSILGFILNIVLLSGLVVGVVIFVKKQKAAVEN
ncbi:SH3 domain-containing protein [Chitinispirillales bacterium ANBcel5]|uniref:hypothetical protein n=1 Tax=Cellulosispirillum alkaliphilum TaxID=3039283 RepID=UPI002A560DF7|nr:SH3 domain-containing protein [Chitinispirillales bacterium ANBcel5]